jgi:orotate phosphoribosyltransferase
MKTIAEMLRDAGVVRKGKVRLASGRTADFYINVKAAYGRPLVFSRLVRELSARVPTGTTCIASGGYGGIPLASAVALRLKLPLTLIRAKPKTHGTAQWLDGAVPTSHDRIALIDDVYTTGGSLAAMAKALRPTRARIIARLVVVDRSTSLPRTIRALVHVRTPPL